MHGDPREVRARLASAARLAEGMAHEVSNILQALAGAIALVRMHPQVSSGISKGLDLAEGQIARGARLIDQLLDFGHPEPLDARPLDLASFLANRTEVLERTVRSGVRVELTVEPGSYQVVVDRKKVDQVLIELALNARDAMAGSGVLRLRLSRWPPQPGEPAPSPELASGQWVRLEVADTGEGIPAAVLPRIFEPFVTTKRAGDGAGLGLAKVYAFVSLHGGLIDVETAEGTGTTFIVYLPRRPRPARTGDARGE